MLKLLSIAVFLPASLCQFDNLKADVTFDENNDRFDLTNLLYKKNQLYNKMSSHIKNRDNYQIPMRRNLGSENGSIENVEDTHKKISQQHSNNSRREHRKKYVYHDSEDDGTSSNIEDNIKKIIIFRTNLSGNREAIGTRRLRTRRIKASDGRVFRPDAWNDIMKQKLPADSGPEELEAATAAQNDNLKEK